MEDHPGYGRWATVVVAVGGIVLSPFFVVDDAPPDNNLGEAGARMAQITFGSTTVNSAQPGMENTYIGRNFDVIPPDPADKVAALVRGRAIRYVGVIPGSVSST